MKNRSMRLVSCVILSLVVHTALAATFFYAVKPKPVTLEISNPIRVSLVDDYSSATGTEDDDSLSSGLTGDSAQEFSNETDLTENGQFDPNILEMQMVAAIELQAEIATAELQSETIEDLDDLLSQDSNKAFRFDAAIESKNETKDELTKENLDSIVSKLEETSASATIPVTEHPVPVRVENPSNESQNEIPESSNDAKPPEAIKSIVNVQSEDLHSHSEQDIAVRNAVNEKPLPGSDPIEPESLSQTFGNHQAAAVNSAKIDNFDNANYNPVSPDFDSEFVRWAQLDFESVSNAEPDKSPETKNNAVDQALNPEVIRSIRKFEESLSAEFNNPTPDEVTLEENSQHPSQFAAISDSSGRSPIVSVQLDDIYSHSEQDIAVRDAVNEEPLPGLEPIESESLSQTFGNHQAAAVDSAKIDNFDNANYNPVSADFDSEFVRWAQLDFESVSNTEPDKSPETKNNAVEQTLNPEVIRSIRKFEESLSAEFNNSIPDEVTQEENSHHPSQFAAISDSSGRSPIVSVQSEDVNSHSEPDIAVRDAVHGKPLPRLDPIEPESLSQTFSDHQAAAAEFVKTDNFDNVNSNPVSPDFDSEFVRWAQLDFESVSNTEPDKSPETKNNAVEQTLNPEVIRSIRKLEENLSVELNNSIPDEVTQEENLQHPSQFAAKSDSSERSPIVSVPSENIYSHSEPDIAVRDAVNETPLPSLDPIEPESLSQTFSNHQAAAVDSVKIDNFDNGNYDPVSPDFDSEFVRWAQLDFESISHTELDKNPGAKNVAADQTLNPEVFRSIDKIEKSLSAVFNNSTPDEVSQEENPQHPSQSASNPDNGERSDTDQLVENSIAHLTKQNSTEQLSQQQSSHADSESNRESSANSPTPISSQKVASIAGVSANSSPKYGIEGFPNPAPRYPYLSRANGEEGKVILQVVVDKYGLAAEITIIQSSGYRRLDKAATKAVKKWKFQPALKGEINVQGVVQVPISFVLRNS